MITHFQKMVWAIVGAIGCAYVGIATPSNVLGAMMGLLTVANVYGALTAYNEWKCERR